MHKINCTVKSCYYNKEQFCQIETLHIAGKGSGTTEATYCHSYTAKESAHNKAGEGTLSGTTSCICCEVNTCVYNKEKKCSLSEIEVSSLGEVSDCKETDCLSFDRCSY